MSGGGTSLSLLQKCRNIPLICKYMNVYLHAVNIPPLPAETVLAPDCKDSEAVFACRDCLCAPELGIISKVIYYKNRWRSGNENCEIDL